MWFGKRSFYSSLMFGKERSKFAELLDVIDEKLYHAELYIRYRFDPNHQYHILRTGLKPGYYDIDTIMEHSLISLLNRYVEDEMGGLSELLDRIDFLREEDYPDHVTQEEEIMEAYVWFKYENCGMKKLANSYFKKWSDLHDGKIIGSEPIEGSKCSRIVVPERTADYQTYKHLIDEHEAKTQAMLERIVKIRQSLWT